MHPLHDYFAKQLADKLTRRDGTPATGDRITLVRWDINIPATGPTEPWELWVDDVTLYGFARPFTTRAAAP